jgi:hypothetical protein
VVWELRYSTRLRSEDLGFDEVVVLFNPWAVLGFASGKDKVSGSAQLEIVAAGRVAGRYAATCSIEKTRSIYTAGDFSGLRGRALELLQRSIESQMLWTELSSNRG